jgi:hypothetical protein
MSCVRHTLPPARSFISSPLWTPMPWTRWLPRVACVTRYRLHSLENNCFAVMRSSSEEGSYLRLVDLLYHSTLGQEY